MPINVLMPALSPTMEKGNLAKWLKKEGDPIKSGDVLAEIETDKATMEVEAIDEGVLAKILVPEGTADVPVNDLIAIIAAEGEDVAAAAAGGAPKAASNGAANPEPKAEPSAAAQNTTPGGGHMAYERVNAAPEGAQPGGTSQAASGSRVFASPLARRIAKQEGVELGAVQGSGPHGRIMARDVQAAKVAGATKAPAPQAAAEAPKRQLPPRGRPRGWRTGRPHHRSGRGLLRQGSLRGRAEQRHAQDHRQAPHRGDAGRPAFLPDGGLRTRRADEAARDAERLNRQGQDGKPAFKLSVNDFVIKAMGLALTRVPAANAVWSEDRILRFKNAEVGVAVAIDGGLFTPGSAGRTRRAVPPSPTR